MTLYCLVKLGRDEKIQSIYGCSRSLENAVAALDRGRKRGVTWASVVPRKSAPRGVRVNEWLSPFEDRKAGFR